MQAFSISHHSLIEHPENLHQSARTSLGASAVAALWWENRRRKRWYSGSASRLRLRRHNPGLDLLNSADNPSTVPWDRPDKMLWQNPQFQNRQAGFLTRNWSTTVPSLTPCGYMSNYASCTHAFFHTKGERWLGVETGCRAVYMQIYLCADVHRDIPL